MCVRLLLATGAFAAIASHRLMAQEPTSDPHVAQPERPTVATHAGTVSPGWVEIEAGVLRSEAGGLLVQTPIVTKFGVVSHVQLSLFLDWQAQNGPRHNEGLGDAAIGVKWRVLDHAPIVGDFAVLPILKLPTGVGGTTTSTSDLSVVLISSHDFGRLSLDANVGYTHRSGSGLIAPRTATLWTVSAGLTIAGPFGVTGEISGFPGTGDRSGEAPIVASLAGVTFAARKWLVFDAGVSPTLHGPQASYVFSGATWNIGHL